MKNIKMNSNKNSIINLCKLSKQKLRTNLIKYLYNKNIFTNIKYSQNYIIAEGQLPICLIAHIDTVFKHTPEEFIYDQEKKVLWSPGGSGFDDRVGIYLILQLINEGFCPSIIFTDLEEAGGIGSYELINDYSKCPFKDCRALIQLDRMGKQDAVFYNCNNSEFTKFICKYGFKKEKGSFSDISIIAPAWRIAAVNLSVGYMDEHFPTERLYINWMENTFYKIKKILQECNSMKKYKYIPKENNYPSFSYGIPFGETFDWEHRCAICEEPLGDIYFIDHDCDCRICNNCYNLYYLRSEEDTDKITA